METDPDLHQILGMEISPEPRHKSTARDYAFLGIFLFLWVVISVCSTIWMLRLSVSARRALNLIPNGSGGEEEEEEEDRRDDEAKARLRVLERVAPTKTLKDWRISIPEINLPVESSSQLLVCTICLDAVLDDSPVHALPCQHAFHSKCLECWFLGGHGNCPLCLVSLSPEDEDTNQEV
ncbi:hypothetical protein BJX76DRAFT_335030 [Aspergillus varians]